MKGSIGNQSNSKIRCNSFRNYKTSQPNREDSSKGLGRSLKQGESATLRNSWRNNAILKHHRKAPEHAHDSPDHNRNVTFFDQGCKQSHVGNDNEMTTAPTSSLKPYEQHCATNAIIAGVRNNSTITCLSNRKGDKMVPMCTRAIREMTNFSDSHCNQLPSVVSIETYRRKYQNGIIDIRYNDMHVSRLSSHASPWVGRGVASRSSSS